MQIRSASERGHADHGWLKTHFTFSFAEYFDPAHMGFGALRVINDDRVAAGKGFGDHPHRDMEIITYVLDGAVAHKDSMGNRTVIPAGDVQRMSAGAGVIHSEHNPLDRELHLLQIWILPERRGGQPGYEQKAFPPAERRGRFTLIASKDGRDGSLTMHQDASLYSGVLDAGTTLTHAMPQGRRTWIHVARGAVEVNGKRLATGDGAGLIEAGPLSFTALEPTEVLVFDLP